MFGKLATFEFNYFRRQPSFYVTGLIFFLLTFFAMISDNVQIGGTSNVNFNSPHAIVQTMLIMSMIGMFLVANFVGGTATRDHAFKMSGFMLSTPISKGSYLWGRLFGSLLFCLLVFVAVPLGTLIGSAWYSVDPERLGPTLLTPYLWGYLIFVIPNFIFCSVLFYSFAMIVRSMMGMYLGVVGFFILYEVSGQLLRNPAMERWGTLLDPFGFSAFLNVTRYWTPFEKNTELVALAGPILENRVLWLAVSVVIVALVHWLMDLRRAPKFKTKASKTKSDVDPDSAMTYQPTVPSVGHRIDWQRFWLRTRFEVSQVIKSAPFLVLSMLTLFILGSAFFDGNNYFGTANWPLTRDMSELIQGSFSLLILIIMTYYAAETVWRERQLGVGDIVESTPIANWGLYFPKVIDLWSITLSLLAVGVGFSVVYQASAGYTNFEWGVYVGTLMLQYTIPSMMLVVLSVFVQILSPNKYVGMLVFVLYIIGSLVLAQLGLEHRLWRFSEGPEATYSDLNGFGHFLTPMLWYSVYWLGLTLILVVLGFGLWRRGAEYGLKQRIALLRSNIGGVGLATTILGALTFVAVGTYIFYSTRVLNEFRTSEQLLNLQAAYERAYKQHQGMPLPTITDVSVNVDIFPTERRVDAQGHYLIENHHPTALDKTLVGWDRRNQLSLHIEGGQATDFDETFSTAWIQFDPPVQPGETRRIDYQVERINLGFVDASADNRVVENGTFINNDELLPFFGYNADYEIIDRHDRRKRDLPPPQRVPKLEDDSQYGTNFLGDDADFINFEAVVSTSEDQVAIAPGYLQREWIENGRRYFHFKMDAPIFNFVAFLSGRYAVEKDDHNGIAIEVYHHADHNMNVARMIEAVKDSLDYFGREFSPYQHRQVRIIEFPRYASFAQSFSNTVPYSEDIGFVADLRDPNDIDYVYFVTAHEMAHQWWGHQVTPANVQGAGVLTESLSEYSAYMVLEKKYGPDHMRRFLKWEMDRYLRGRGNEVLEEMPLMRAENQQYIHYAKGGIVMYALRDRLGEEVFNGALRAFLERYQYADNPYPTTVDFLRYLKAAAPIENHAFIDDMFSNITLFDLKVQSATAKAQDGGGYEIELVLAAEKFYADGQGEESSTPLDEQFDIGVFSADPDDAEAEDHVLYFKKHLVQTGENRIVVRVEQLPRFAGIDPYIKMIDRNSDDNLIPVTLLDGE